MVEYTALIVALASAVAVAVAVVFLAVKRSSLLHVRQTESIASTLNEQIIQLWTKLEQLQVDAKQLQVDFAQQRVGVEQLQIDSEHLQGRCDSISQTAEHLKVEKHNLSVLAQHHPLRKNLVRELKPRFEPIYADLEPVLFPNQLPFDENDWMQRMKSKRFPYSLTFEEGMVLYHLVSSHGFKRGYEIATAFGLSSFFLGLAMKKNGGHMISVDAYIEESEESFLYDADRAQQHALGLKQALAANDAVVQPDGLRFARQGAVTLGIVEQVTYDVGFSPDDVPRFLGNQTIDFAFIDGGHFGEQPILDTKAVLPYLEKDRCLLLYHDTQCEAVAAAAHFAADQLGEKIHSIHTRNRVVAVGRGLDDSIIEQCREICVRQYR